MPDFVMPSLGADMDAGTLVEQRKRVGEAVHRGDILAAVETDKGVIEVEAFHEGVVERWLVPVGQKVAVGTTLAVLRADADTTPATVMEEASAPEPTPIAQAPTPAPITAESTPTTTPSPSSKPASMPPSARRRALELDVDPAAVHGTGRHGTITRDDIEAAASHREDAHPAPRAIVGSRRAVSPYARRRARALGVDLEELARTKTAGAILAADVERAAVAPRADAPTRSPEQRMRAAISAAMARSKREIPHYYVAHTIDMTNALAHVATHNARVGVDDRVLPIALLLRAVTVALRKVPELNAHFVDEGAPPIAEVNLGVAISLRKGGVVAPAILRADQMSLVAMMRALDDLVLRARSGHMRASELASGTITVTSLGDRGVESVTPVIFPPQVAMVGFGKIMTQPFVVDDRVMPRQVVHVTLAADHRVSDGHRGGLYLAEVERLLSNPESL